MTRCIWQGFTPLSVFAYLAWEDQQTVFWHETLFSTSLASQKGSRPLTYHWQTLLILPYNRDMSRSEEILINGAGPTGLLLASQLALRDVAFRIIDKNADHTTQSRALVVQARSLEIFDQMEIAQEALRLGEKAQAVGIIVNGKRMLRMDVSDIGEGLTAYPYLLMLEQSNTEKILNTFLVQHGHAVERNTELLDFTQDADSVTATLRHADGKEEIVRADWLVGADGAHSLVRHTLSIPFSGRIYQQLLFVLDCKVNLDVPSDEMYLAFSARALAGFFPMTNGRYRVIGMVPEAFEGQETITFEDVAKDFAERLQMDVTLQDPQWIAMYHSHHRAVAAFRKGRCFLAGDAAHIHSPVGAQGMNTGLQDAYNLAWKLALVAQGKAKETLLDTYNDERLPVAHNLVRTTDRAFNIFTSQNPLAKGFRVNVVPVVMQAVLPFAQKQKFVRQLAFKTISEIGIHYRESNLSQEDPQSQFPRHAPKPGDRVPYIPLQEHSVGIQEMVKGTKFHLVLYVGEGADEKTQQELHELKKEYSDFIDFHEVVVSDKTRVLYEKFGIRRQGYYFIRPDGHIASRNSHLDVELFRSYLQRFLIKR